MSQNINLYDPSLRARRDWLAFEGVASAIAIALVLVAACAFGARWSLARTEPVAAASATELQARQSAMQTLATQNASAKPDAAMQAEIARAQRLLLQRRAALQNLDGGGSAADGGFSSRLEALARQSIDGLWLTGLSLRQDDVLLRGRATNPALIPVYVQRLEQEPSLQGRAFKALDVNRPLETPSDRPVATAADSAPGLRAEFVEFTLMGPGSLPLLLADKGTKP